MSSEDFSKLYDSTIAQLRKEPCECECFCFVLHCLGPQHF